MNGEDQKFEIYFVTKVTLRRVRVFKLSPKYARIVIDNFKFYREKYHIKIYGYVIMPDHYHLIVDTLGRVSIAKFKEDMNKYIARCIIQDLKIHHPEILNRLAVEVKP